MHSPCLKAYGDIVNKAKVVSDRLSAKPIAISIPHPRTQEKIIVNLSAEDFSGVIRLALYSRDLSSLIPRVISEAEAGSYELFASLIYLAKSKSDMAGVSYGMHYAVVCNEDYPLYKNKNALDSNVFLNAHSVQKYSKVCEQLPLGKLPEKYWEPIVSDLPALLLSGAVDPVTPPRWGALVKSRLKNAEHLIVPGGHHIVTAEGCVAQLITAFIAKGDAHSLDSSCVKNIQPLAIHLPVSAFGGQSTLDAPGEAEAAGGQWHGAYVGIQQARPALEQALRQRHRRPHRRQHGPRIVDGQRQGLRVARLQFADAIAGDVAGRGDRTTIGSARLVAEQGADHALGGGGAEDCGDGSSEQEERRELHGGSVGRRA
jgi:hypothetical protein